MVSDTFERGGRVIIPAFSVGRTQNVVYHLGELFHAGELAPVKVYVDSPLAIDATEAYRNHPECFDKETQALLAKGHSPFGFELVTYTRTTDSESPSASRITSRRSKKRSRSARWIPRRRR
ncbi:MAG: hypothetical protein HY812_17595 [Planctomycetes bacterium]|nr:hypothetical protein [Planctomycetota bacterium]